MKIVTDEKILRQVSKPITKDDDIDTIVQQLKEANATAWTDGCGLAGIQIGIPKRIAWLNTGKSDKDEIILVNPEILKTQGPNVAHQEGCLSIPNKSTLVMRPQTIFVKFNTLDDDGKVYEVSGWTARAIQHEIDHMDGILNIDKEHVYLKCGRNEPCPCGSGKKFKKCCG